ncbi:MAG: hypothetical protein DHS20C13_29330 [Thermodesulfobacteriota bacterium]|nr:MAG: hypothetical protein DHS20C13_29330 [Thermodesulfobacteriota bacterium]
MNLKSGVLIIGSLLWQDYVHRIGDDIRLNWRNSYLDLDNKIHVKVPIRYGRISNSEIPTMVFSNYMKTKLGFGYLVPFKNKIHSEDQLISHTVALSVAEGMRGNFVTSWGVLVYLFNNNKISNEDKKEIVRFFRKRKNRSFEIKDYKTKGERSCLTKSMKLDINWIEPIAKSDQEELETFDVIFATATKPNPIRPTTKILAEKIWEDTDRMYFLNNLANGIITQDDFEISSQLKRKK